MVFFLKYNLKINWGQKWGQIDYPLKNSQYLSNEIRGRRIVLKIKFYTKKSGSFRFRIFLLSYLSVSLFQHGVSIPRTSEVKASSPFLKWAVAFFTYLKPI